MKDYGSQRLTLVVIVAITGFGFLCWLGVLLFVWLFLRAAQAPERA